MVILAQHLLCRTLCYTNNTIYYTVNRGFLSAFWCWMHL